jgi:NADPH:quinone reductase-like Zn-dependent oxidoreductase
VLIKTGAAGFCHTDYQVWEGVYKSPLPIAGSHEPVGTIVAVGSEAQSKWKVGQRVGVLLFRHACHACGGCKASNDIRFCENGDFAGLKADGGFAEYIIGDASNIVALPDEVPFEQGAPLMCAGVSQPFLLLLWCTHIVFKGHRMEWDPRNQTGPRRAHRYNWHWWPWFPGRAIRKSSGPSCSRH